MNEWWPLSYLATAKQGDSTGTGMAVGLLSDHRWPGKPWVFPRRRQCCHTTGDPERTTGRRGPDRKTLRSQAGNCGPVVKSRGRSVPLWLAAMDDPYLTASLLCAIQPDPYLTVGLLCVTQYTLWAWVLGRKPNRCKNLGLSFKVLNMR